MARDFAQLYQSIWSDPDFRARSVDEQLLYIKLLSWETLNYAGVLPLQTRKWARATAGATAAGVEATLQRLDAARYALVDWDTEEVLLRTFIRGDRLYKNPPMLRAALRLALQVESARLRNALGLELTLIRGLVSDSLVADVQGAVDALSHPVPDPVPHGVPDGVPNLSETPVPDQVSDPVPDGVGDGAGTGTGAVEGVGVVTSAGDVTEADARERDQPDDQPPAVPDTATAPLEHDPEADEQAYADFVADARQRTTTPPASPIEGAMPPDRCRNHLELADPPPCGRCKQAREAQEAWIDDRDAKVAAARTAAQAEIAAQKAAERAEIDRCDRCDDRGILPSAVVCTHDNRSDPDAVPPGRAAYLAARAAEKARMAGKAKTTPDAPPATGEQLRLIAIRFGERGIADRDTRLDVIGDVVGRPITTTRELTRAEASVILDRFDHPLPDEPPADDDGEPAADPRWSDPGWARVPLDDGGPDDPGTFIPVIGDASPEDHDQSDEDDAADDDDGLPDEFDEQYQADQDTWTEPEADYVYAGGGDDGPPF